MDPQLASSSTLETLEDFVNFISNLYNLVKERQWEKVVEVCKAEPTAYLVPITSSGDTALHVAVSQCEYKQAEELVKAMTVETAKDALHIKNERGNSPLHLAASLGSVRLCDCIAHLDPTLLNVPNEEKETPLILATLHGKKDAFLGLHHHIRDHDDPRGPCYSRAKDGNTILHIAILGEYFDLAFQIICRHPELCASFNDEGMSPLQLLASKPTAFRSGSQLKWYHMFIYHCTTVHELELDEWDPKLLQIKASKNIDNHCRYPDNYETCIGLFKLLKKPADFVMKLIKKGPPEGDAENQRGNQSTNRAEEFLELVKILAKAIMLFFLKFGGPLDTKKIHKEKEKHMWSYQIMDELLKQGKRYKGVGTSPNPGAPVESGAKTPGDTGKPENQTPGDTGKPENQTPGDTGKLENQTSCDTGKRENQTPGDTDKPEIQTKRETSPLIARTNSVMEKVERILDKLADSYKPENQTKRKTSSLIARTNSVMGKVERILDKLTDSYKPKNQTKDESALLIAAKNGIPEMVEGFLSQFPHRIDDVNSEGKNIVLLAVEHRQPHICQLVLKRIGPEKWGSVCRQVDKKGNSVLHLAATLGEYQPWLIPGAALQMQWELKWYEYVKNSMPFHFRDKNHRGETPKAIFIETHKDLLKAGGEWLIKTSESCSVVTALIATVAFATSVSVPGGIKEFTGTPTLENHPAFYLFAVSSLVALCFSVTSLIMFLAILTSRLEEKDFKNVLPGKLLLGLTSQLVSIASILVSFCAGHFFELKDKVRYAAVPIYAVACLPVVLFAILQLPLYSDLVRSFLKKVPKRGYMVVTQ